MEPLPHVGLRGPRGTDSASASHAPRCFHGAAAIAALDGVLYVADTNGRRVQAFDLRTLALLAIHDGVGVPADLAAGSGAIHILDGTGGRVYRLPHPDGQPQLVVAPDAGPADRIALDTAGRIYLRRRRGERTWLDVYDLAAGVPATGAREHVADAAQVRDRFAPPAVTMDGTGVLAVPDSLLDPCGQRRRLPDGGHHWRAGGLLYSTDPATRSLDALLPDGRLRHRWDPRDADGNDVAGDADDAWRVVDGTATGATAWILDERHQRIWSHRTGDGALRLRFGAPAGAPRHWRRIAADRAGCLLLWDGSSDVVERRSGDGSARGTVPLAAVRTLFDAAPLQPPHWPAVQLTRSGARPAPAGAAPAWPAAVYHDHGVWTSTWLDSGIHDCQWHVIDLDIASLPPGASLRLRSRTTNDTELARNAAPGLRGSWDDMQGIIAPAQPEAGQPTRMRTDLLVQSGPGRYLQLQVELVGDGRTTPVLDHLRLHFPRESLLDFLPAQFSAPPAQRVFLDRLLAIVNGTWGDIERTVDSFERYVDPDAVPDDALPWLAEWLDVRLEGGWTPAQNRRLLRAAPRLRTRWGTPGALREGIRIYLANLSGIDEATLVRLDVPAIVESFVERRQLQLGDASATLGAAQALWSPAAERRYQVGVFDRLGEVELVSTGDPDTDALRHYAHGFRVYVPASLVRTPADEARLRRAITSQAPAHATFGLVLTEPRLCIGVQSTIGLDTVIADPAPTPLPCRARPDAPSRQPAGLLGVDTILAGAHDPTGRTRILA
jgi:phage tail-like protein